MPAKRPCGCGALRQLDRADGDLAAARIVLGVELHLLAFAKALDASALQCGGMNEDVLAAIIRLDETKAFLAIVELDGARSHICPFTDGVHGGTGVHDGSPVPSSSNLERV